MKGLSNVLLFILLGFQCGCEQQETREKIEVIGYTGAARKNPYLAAERYLRENGRIAEARTGVVEMESEVDAVIAPASTIRSRGDVERVMRWVESGGHYICLLARGEDFWKDVGSSAHHDVDAWYDQDDQKGMALEGFLSRAGYEIRKITPGHRNDEFVEITGEDARLAIERGEIMPDAELTEVEIAGRSHTMLLGGTLGVAALASKEKEGRRYVSVQYGEGRITILSDARALRNPYLGMEDHAQALEAMVGDAGVVVFSLGSVPSFLDLLGEHASKVILALVVLLFLWLWKCLPRFGPAMEVEETGAGRYLDHLSNTGNFLWRNGCSAELLIPMREAIRQKAGRLQDQLGREDEWHAELVAESGLNQGQISEAMTLVQVTDAGQMVRIIRNLQIIYQAL